MTKHTRPRDAAIRRREILRRLTDYVCDMEMMLDQAMGDFTLDETERLTTAHKKLAAWITRARGAR